jgi:uncharacterized protein (DUF1697 family)
MSEYVALLRGINVGTAKRIAMVDLRAVMSALGYGAVRTVLNSGNVVFNAARGGAGALAGAIEAAVARKAGFTAPVVVVTAADWSAIMAANVLLADAAGTPRNPAQLLIAFVQRPALLAAARPLCSEDWGAERLAIGTAAAYLWCPAGIADSKLFKAFDRATDKLATTRNCSTVVKIHATLTA